MVQMSLEMWQLDWNGSQFIERATDFIGELLEKWNKHKCTHTVSIVLFSRLVYHDLDRSVMTPEQKRMLKYDPEHNTHFRDLYRLVLDDERRLDKQEVLLLLKREFAGYRALLAGAEAQLSSAMSAAGSAVLTGVNSSAESGNMLEAINMYSALLSLAAVPLATNQTHQCLTTYGARFCSRLTMDFTPNPERCHPTLKVVECAGCTLHRSKLRSNRTVYHRSLWWCWQVDRCQERGPANQAQSHR
jgi:hypothetical protein